MVGDFGRGCFPLSVMLDSDQKENGKSDRADVGLWILQSTVIKKTFTDTIRVKWLWIFFSTGN